MKKFIVAIMAVLFAAPSFAQFSSGGFSLDENSVYYGIRLGVNFAGLSGDFNDKLGTKVGMNLGGVIGLRLSQTTPVFLESGLYYTERGAKDGKDKASLTYLEIPVLIKYGIQTGGDFVVLPYIGPYFSYGIAGKTKIHSPEGNINESSYEFFKHGDMGFKLGCGAEYNNLYAELGYQFGVANILDVGDDEARNHAFYINIGVNF